MADDDNPDVVTVELVRDVDTAEAVRRAMGTETLDDALARLIAFGVMLWRGGVVVP